MMPSACARLVARNLSIDEQIVMGKGIYLDSWHPFWVLAAILQNKLIQHDSTAIMQLWKSQLLNPVQDLWAHGATSFFLKSFPDPLLYPQENKLRLVLGYALTFSHWLTPIPSFSHLGNQTWNFQIDILNQKIKGPDNPTSQLLPKMSFNGFSRDGEGRKDKGGGERSRM